MELRFSVGEKKTDEGGKEGGEEGSNCTGLKLTMLRRKNGQRSARRC